jgi:hypothetical protein
LAAGDEIVAAFVVPAPSKLPLQTAFRDSLAHAFLGSNMVTKR